MKKDDFKKDLAEWQKKYSSLFTNEEIDQISERDRTIEPDIRHPEDFELVEKQGWFNIFSEIFLYLIAINIYLFVLNQTLLNYKTVWM